MIDSSKVANPFDRTVDRLRADGWSADEATQRAVEEYLDGKPRLARKKKITRAERDAAFWDSALVKNLPVERWKDAPYTLALTHCAGSDRERWRHPAPGG